MDASIVGKVVLYSLAAAHAALGCFLVYKGFSSDIMETYKPKLDGGSKISIIAGCFFLFGAIIMAAATYFA